MVEEGKWEIVSEKISETMHPVFGIFISRNSGNRTVESSIRLSQEGDESKRNRRRKLSGACTSFGKRNRRHRSGYRGPRATVRGVRA